MTSATEMVDKTTMEIKTYSKDEVMAMVAEIMAATGWSRAKIVRELDISEHVVKDWYRKDRDNQVDYLHSVKVAELYKKVAIKKPFNDLYAARAHIDDAIRLWFESNDNNPSVHTLAEKGYKGFFPQEDEVNLATAITERLIILCLAELQLKHIPLTREEMAFTLWFAANDSLVTRGNAKELFSRFIEEKDKIKAGKPDKAAFFKAFTSEGTFQGS